MVRFDDIADWLQQAGFEEASKAEVNEDDN